MKKAVIIGAGKTTRDLIDYMKSLEMDFKDSFFICLDNDNSLWGTDLEGVIVKAVEEIRKYPDSEIVISSIYEKDIRKQLEQFGIGSFIINYIDFKRMIFADYQVRKYNALQSNTESVRRQSIKKIIVYTVIFGGYDLLREVIYPKQNIKYICFTDDKALQSDTWEIVYVNREFDDPVLESRKYKMLPHLFIDAEYSLYIDASVQFNKSPLDYMNQFLIRGNMLLVPHEERDCIYEEMAMCILIKKDLPQRLIQQAHIYMRHKCPEHSGLYLGGIIGRKHFEKEVIKFDEEWWEHFKKYSRRDQVSLGYLIWEKKMSISLANLNVRNNVWFNVKSCHKI